MFEQSTFYFVLTKNNITHVVSFYDLDKLPVKLSLFSLLLELESKIIDLLSLDQTKIESFLNSLSASRLSKARNLCKLKYGEETPRNLLLCTTFIDKKEMLLKSSNFKEKLPFESRKKLNSFFKKVEDVRNQIAHSDSIIEILPLPRKWNIFIQDLSSLIKAIARIRN